MQVTREIETKLSVPDGFEMPPLTEVKGVLSLATRALRLRATYYDSEDLRLARGRTTLRHRTGEGRPCWTLKLEPTSGPGREELTVVGPGTSVPAVLQDLLTARLRGAALEQVVQLRTRRRSSLLLDADGQELAEVVDDQVDVSDGRSWRELEVELRDGGDKVAERVLELLRATGAEVGDQTPKAVRALGAAAAGPPDLPEPGRVRAKDPAGALVLWSLRDSLRGLVQHDTGVRRGLDDAIHQLRVTCRRMRSDLRTFAPLLADPRTEALRTELAWLADSLGAARDLEVLRVRLQGTAGELDVTEIDVLLEARQHVALDTALAALRSTRYLLLLQLLHDVASEPVLTELAEQPCKEVLPGILDKAWHHLERASSALTVDAEDAAWHRSRILAKRARYAAESAEVALGKRVHARAKAAKRVQTLLGEIQDGAIAEQAVLDLADAHPDDHRLAVLCGRLADRERRNLLALRRTYLRRPSLRHS